MIPLPNEFQNFMREMLGDEAPAFFASLEEDSTLALRINPMRTAPCVEKYIDSSVPWEECGFYLKKNAKPGASIAHAAGAFYLQEASAMLSVAVLNPQPGERILDLCAAPGGKSTQIAAHMRNQGLLIANEPDASRCKVLASNLERMGCTHAVALNAYPNALSNRFAEEFDAILCDAPCSGEGMFRREPHARSEWKPSSPLGCAKRQAEILDHAALMLKKGGRMVYSTCTFNREENEQTIAAFLDRHPDFAFEDFEIEGVGQSENGCLRILPHRQRGDGHFAALLRKRGNSMISSTNSTRPTKIDRNHAKYVEMLENSICRLPEAWKQREFRQIGDYLYAVPENCPDFQGVKAAMHGLCLLRIGKNHIEPAHALAMGLPMENAHRRIELSADLAAKYLAGETIEIEAEKGWTLVTHENLPLGWGKISNDQLKNHLPKGLRCRVY